jgi:hypothetical protein
MDTTATRVSIRSQDVLTLAIIGIGVYAVWQLLKKLPTPSQAADAIAAPIASALTQDPFFAPLQTYVGPAITQSGQIILPNGAPIPITGSGLQMDASGQFATFNYGGTTYAVAMGSRDANGNYPATTLNGLGASGGNWRGL